MEKSRLAVVRLLAKLFGSKDSDLATQNRPLWQCSWTVREYNSVDFYVFELVSMAHLIETTYIKRRYMFFNTNVTVSLGE